MIVYVALFFTNYSALSIWPFIFIKDKSDRYNKVLINHERIHLRQQIEMLWIFFFIWYILEFLIRYLQYQNWHKAYRMISFEKEAYENETDFNYLKTKSMASFVKYL